MSCIDHGKVEFFLRTFFLLLTLFRNPRFLKFTGACQLGWKATYIIQWTKCCSFSTACLRQGLAILVVLSLSLSLVLHKFSVERLYHTSIVRTQQVYSPVHCCADILPSVVKPIPNFIHISYHNSSDSHLSQNGSENLPQHSLHQQKQYNLSSVPPSNWPHNGTENYVHSIPTKNHHSTGTANSVPKNYHLDVHMQQGQYASKYVKFGAESDLSQPRKSQTEIVSHSDHIPYTSQLQPGGQEVQVVPSRLQQKT